MQDIIRLLPDNVSNQIAAGEVVQRPSSVVKELLENAIDAEATKIQLIVKEAGRNLIQVIDNGIGMSLTDARMAFERHATSKIHQSDDIYKINTKGFRGEALASIAAVAQVELKTKRAEDEIGTRIVNEANDVKLQEPDISAKGSNFSVKNLFYNVPARRKFLKSNHVEFKHIIDEFLRVALTHTEIEFQLIHNDKEVYKLKPQKKAQRIVEIFGKKIESNLVPVSEDLGWITLQGYIGKPEAAKKKRGEQFFFVNNRFFRSAYFNRAILDAYEGLIPNGYTPSYFIYFSINPEKIDVNIHPSKTEIKFENESDLYALLRSSLKQSIGVYHLAPSLDFEQEPQWQGNHLSTKVKKQVTPPSIQVNPNYNPFSSGNGSSLPTTKEKIAITELYQSSISNENPLPPSIDFESKEQKAFRLSNGLWTWEYENALWLIHPYRVHQTVLYHRIKKQNKENRVSQQLLFPIEFPVDERQKVLLTVAEKQLFELGFDLDFSSEFLTINAIPHHLHSEHIPQLFDALFQELDRHQDSKFLDYFYQKVAFVSAKTKNHWKDAFQISDLLQQFIEINTPLYSPNNNLNFNKFPLEDISKSLQ